MDAVLPVWLSPFDLCDNIQLNIEGNSKIRVTFTSRQNHRIIASSHHRIIASSHHRIIASSHHRIFPTFVFQTLIPMRQFLFLIFACIIFSNACAAQSGCTDITACNYDPLAVTNDYSCYGYGDLDCNYQIDAIDYMIFMQHYGCPAIVNNSPTLAVRCDMDGSGTIGMSDLILLIAELGYIYNP